MKQFINKKLFIVGDHSHKGEEVIGVKIGLYQSKANTIGEEALICKNTKDITFYVFDKEDIKVLK